jgi:hypothetical protein
MLFKLRITVIISKDGPYLHAVKCVARSLVHRDRAGVRDWV